jgi:hypothetical protein
MNNTEKLAFFLCFYLHSVGTFGLVSTKFHEIMFSSFRGVALTNCVTDRRTDDRTKTICLPTKVGGDIINSHVSLNSTYYQEILIA